MTTTTKLATTVHCTFRLALFGLFCYFEWGCYEKWAAEQIATASSSKQARYQNPFTISICPLDYVMPEAKENMVTLTIVINVQPKASIAWL